jgi:pSer/pThr/pTyr-binding forkhead associated (FHA) protein
VGRVPPVDDALTQQIEQRFPTVSRLHAELSVGQDGYLYLRDMGSLNGTCIDNQPLTTPFACHRVQVGAELSFSSKLHAKVDQA